MSLFSKIVGQVLGYFLMFAVIYLAAKYVYDHYLKGVGDLVGGVGKIADNIGRTAGTPLECDNATEEYNAGLCYPKCPTGYTSDGATICYKNAPGGWPGGTSVTHLQHDTLYSTVGTTNTIPKNCSKGVEYAGLCYDVPDNSWEVTAPGFIGKKCSSVLPGYTRDDGTTCWIDSDTKGRGTGYAWEWGDAAFSLDGAQRRCESQHGQGNCEQYGAIYYPKCQKLFGDKYHESGCCTCIRFAETASKEVRSLIGTLPDQCSDGKQLVGRLCYPNCTNVAKAAGKTWPYERRGDNVEFCSTVCPDGFKNIGIGGCERPHESVGVGKPIHTCNEPKEKDGLLCYPRCNDLDEVKQKMARDKTIKSYKGVGPVCWAQYGVV